MTGTDYIHSERHLRYDVPASPAEQALTHAAGLPIAVGPVNLTWNQSGRGIWPDA